MFRWLFPALGLMVSACRVAGPAQNDKDFVADKNAELLVSLQHFPREGKFPVFEARFFSDRRMVYKGEKRMPLIGSWSFFLHKDMVKNILFEAVNRNLKNAPDSIPVPPDEQKIKLFYVHNGKPRTLVGPSRSGDPIFLDFVKFLQAEVRAMVTDQEGKKEPESGSLRP